MRIRWKLAQFFEIYWWKNYLKKKQTDEYLEKKKIYWEKIRYLCGDALVIEKDQRIADLGCGPSGIYTVLTEQSLTAVDPLLDHYEKHLAVFRKSNYQNVDFITSSIENFTTPLRFDMVFCMNAINHVDDIQQSIHKISEITKPGGTLVMSIDSHRFTFLKNIFTWLPGDILHPHQYDIHEYENMLQKNNFKVLKKIKLKNDLIFTHYMIIAKHNMNSGASHNTLHFAGQKISNEPAGLKFGKSASINA